MINYTAHRRKNIKYRYGLILWCVLILIAFFVGECFRPGPRLMAPLPQTVLKTAALATGRQLPSKRKPAAEPKTPAILLEPTPQRPTPEPTPQGGGIRKIVFSSNRADGRYLQIYIMDANGKNLERLTHSASFDRDPHFSSNGRDVVFTSNRVTGTYQIYLLDADTRAVHPLTGGPEDKTNPVWSPDNQRILFTQHNGKSAQLAIMNADGSDIQQLTSTYGDNYGYSFAPDGNAIAYGSTMNNRNEIFVFDLPTRESRLLMKSDDITQKGKPMFSPRGHLLAFISDALQRKLRQIYLYNLDYRQYYRITDDQLDHNTPFISPDGSRVAYIALWNNAWNIFTMDIDGKNVKNLTQSTYDHYSPTWR